MSDLAAHAPLAFAAVSGKSLDQCGFDPVLRYYSYELGRAKPDPWLYEIAAAELGRRGVSPQETLYVGNDMRNDVWPAAKAGFRTALFAGDERSLRLREDEAKSELAVDPDAVVTELTQIIQLL